MEPIFSDRVAEEMTSKYSGMEKPEKEGENLWGGRGAGGLGSEEAMLEKTGREWLTLPEVLEWSIEMKTE